MPAGDQPSAYLVPVRLQVHGCRDVHQQRAAEVAEDPLDAAEWHKVDNHYQRHDTQQDQRGNVNVEQELQHEGRSAHLRCQSDQVDQQRRNQRHQPHI